MTSVPSATRVASILFYWTGVGGAVSHVLIVAYYFYYGRKPVALSITFDGGGPFDGLGWTAYGIVMALFIVPCALDLLAGRWLWMSRRRGAVLGSVLLPIELLFAVGLMMPFWFVLVPVKACLLAAGWKQLSAQRVM